MRLLPLLLAGCAEPALTLAGDPVAGEALYARECALCHGPEAEGTGRGPALEAPTDQADRRAILAIVQTGSGEMPGFVLTPTEGADLLAWFADL